MVGNSMHPSRLEREGFERDPNYDEKDNKKKNERNTASFKKCFQANLDKRWEREREREREVVYLNALSG